jgi:hypothetical protein
MAWSIFRKYFFRKIQKIFAIFRKIRKFFEKNLLYKLMNFNSLISLKSEDVSVSNGFFLIINSFYVTLDRFCQQLNIKNQILNLKKNL